MTATHVTTSRSGLVLRCRPPAIAAMLALTLACATLAPASSNAHDVTELSLEDLMSRQVTSASKKTQAIAEATSAIFVVTQDDMRRAGASSIPEALRLVPGVHVARIDANKWAIGIRGFNGRYSDKLLVLIDGRSIYSTAFGGVFWEVQDTLLEDVERIEVIRGPGAALWGANAVNGVINVITRTSQESHRGLATVTVGTDVQALGGSRWAGGLGQSADYRAYAKYVKRGSFVDLSGRDARDGWDMTRAGARIDWNASDRDVVTLDSGIHRGAGSNRRLQEVSLQPPFAVDSTNPIEFSGGHVLGRWSRMAGGQPRTTIQFYYSKVKRLDQGDADMDTFDLDLQTRLDSNERHDVLVGIGSRLTMSRFRDGANLSIGEGRRDTSPLLTAFVEDEIKLAKRLRLTLGSRLEHHDNTGLEFQPTVRIRWTPREHHTLWAAASRAVRTPSRLMNELRVDLAAFPTGDGQTALVTLFGNPALESERVTAFEAGYRLAPRTSAFLDVTAFYNRYRALQSNEPRAPYFEADPVPHIVLPQVFGNGLRGESLGFEAAAGWSVSRRWKLSGSYAFHKLSLHREPGSAGSVEPEGTAPRNMLHLGSSLDLGSRVEIDANLYFVGRLDAVDVPSYARLDLRLGLRVASSTDVSFGVKNVLDGRHVEWDGTIDGIETTQVRRSVYASLQFRF